MIIREPAVAGQFYASNPVSLRNHIHSFLKGGQASLDAKGILVPHAGYIYSGLVAGAVYGAIRLPKAFIILGPNHTGKGERLSLYPAGHWRTPLGMAVIDEALNRSLLQECSLLMEDTAAHAREHSIEVHIPFLQMLTDSPAIAAICLGTSKYAALEDLGHSLARTVSSFPEPVLIIASSDMTHFESAESAAKKDLCAIEQVEKLDPAGLYRTVHEKDISMCGFAPAIAMLVACQDLGASAGRLIRYATSGDASGDFDHVVGYAGLVIS